MSGGDPSVAALGRIVILNGAPRSGKSSTARALQAASVEPWVNLGVDSVMALTPPPFRPGIGLRPGGERPDLEPYVVRMFASMYEAVASMSRNGTNAVIDVGHHDDYSRPLGILTDAARRLSGLPALLVGVRCPIETIVRRRDAARATGRYLGSTADGTVPAPVIRWQTEVHRPGIYDLEIDTDSMAPAVCAAAIVEWLESGTTAVAIESLAGGGRQVAAKPRG